MQNHQQLEPTRLANSPRFVSARFIDAVQQDNTGRVDASNGERYSVIEELCVETRWDLEWLRERWLVGRRNETDRLRAGQFEESRGGSLKPSEGPAALNW